jgi:hypothetical protein
MIGFTGTTVSTADIYSSTFASGEPLKNFFAGLTSPNSYFNNAMYSIVQGGQDRLVIRQGGNVGIGTTTPSETLELTRLGKIGFGMNGSYGARIGYFDDGGGVHGFHVDTKHSGTTVSESRFVVRADSGNVGIGTNAPDAFLHVKTGTAQNDAHGLFKIEQTSTAAATPATNSGLTIKNHHGTAQFMQWENEGVRIGSRILTNSGIGDVVFTAGADSEKMRIETNGNVGIGTDNPGGSKLNVTASSTALAGEFLNSGTSGYGLRVTTHSTGAQYGFAVDSYGGGYSRDFTVGADGNVNVLTGNLVIGTAGKGISFAATGNTAGMASELLDDYEEGTWTPDLKALNASSVTHNTGTTKGYYTKIGDLVTVSGTIQWTSNGSNANGGYTVIGGLPYSCKSVTSGRCTGSFGAINGIADAENLNLIIDPGNQFIYITRQSGTTYYHSTTISASGAIYGFQITYRVG